MPRPSLSCRRCPTCSAAFPPTTRRAAPQVLGMGSRMLTLTLALILTPTLTLTLPHPHPHPNPNPNPTLPQPYRSLCAVERSLLGRLGHRPSRLGLTLRAHRLARDDGAHHRTLRRAPTLNPSPNPNPNQKPKPKPKPITPTLTRSSAPRSPPRSRSSPSTETAGWTRGGARRYT